MPWPLSIKSCLVAVLLAAAAQPLAVAGARAGYACRVPRALLCEGCAEAIAITLQRNGTCRISFTPTGAPAQGAGQPTDIEFQVEAPPRPARVIAGFTRPLRRAAWIRPAPEPHCFVFNDQRYCE